MDPITQGAFGAVFAQTQGKLKDLPKAAVIGAIAGMAPDLDVLIRSSEDSLLYLEFHRQFTHSLFFIPIGGFIVSLVLYPLLGKRLNVSYLQTLIWCILGVATHGLLDASTSYGTQLLWPLSNERIAWDIISIIDPFVTIPLITLIILAARRKSRSYVFIAIIWLAIYFGFAKMQHQRALNEGRKLAEARGLTIQKIEAKPSFANIIIWKVITTTKDSYYIDAIKLFGNKTKVWQGTSANKLTIARDLPWMVSPHHMRSQQRKDIERFRWFSQGYISLDKDNPNRIVDIRYSFLPHQIAPMWGIELSQEAKPNQHAEFFDELENGRDSAGELWQMLME